MILKVQFTTERLRLGLWEKGDFNRLMMDFCATMKSDKEPFYRATSKIHSCPFKKGVRLCRNQVYIKKRNNAYLGRVKFRYGPSL